MLQASRVLSFPGLPIDLPHFPLLIHSPNMGEHKVHISERGNSDYHNVYQVLVKVQS